MKTAVFVIILALGVVLVALLVLGARFSRDLDRLEARLAAAPAGAARDDLPEAIGAFAMRGLAGGVPAPAIFLEQAAEMRLKKGANWQAMAARQTIATAQPGFAWVARMRLGPVPVVRVLDAYENGEGLLEVRLFGAIRLDASSGPEMALGEGLRYLAELPWAPDAMLVNRQISWGETDEGITARIETAGGPAEVIFTLDAAGDIVSVLARDRPAALADGTPAPLDWRGRFFDYVEIGGRRVPTGAEVGYDYPDGYEAYFRGRVTALTPRG
ncbi:DUF6544 family protein [Sinisalibacter lacisalsi]|uniref:Uncharacterized protein n=1 Tax=Sinisalibacter lacisalsi TaxID=1526570 RepID=A0ABQ1QUD0_9RHOB|nr:DUF6544 family protein [Sinisalibacter lacisalsi]GGD46749.1 hypothetical protein GCM10011358_33100 [Sinisalibacter lacisalsi]